MHTREQGSVLFAGILILISTLVIIQLWLLSAALEALLGHAYGVLVPAAIGSFLLFGINGLLLWYIVSFDARIRRESGRRPS